MKKRVVLRMLAAASILGLTSLMTYPAQSQNRPTPTTPSPAPSPAPAAPKLIVPTSPQINAAPAQRENKSLNPQGNPSSFDVGKSEKQKAEKAKNDAASLERALLEKKIAKEKKEEKQKMYATGICKKSCSSDPCQCAKFGDATISGGTVPGSITPGPLPGQYKVGSSHKVSLSMQKVCQKQCKTSVSTCQASC